MDTTADAYMYAGVRMMSAHIGPVLTMLKDLATVVIAGVTLWVVVRQWRTDERRLKHEQYEHRAEVFRFVQVYLSEIIRKGLPDDKDLREWGWRTSEKEFLFEADLCTYLDGMYRRSIEFIQHDRELREEPIGTARKRELAQRSGDELGWFADQRDVLRKWFAPYLQITTGGK